MKCLLHPDNVLEDCPYCNALEWKAEVIAEIEGAAFRFGIPGFRFDVLEAMHEVVREEFCTVSGLSVDLTGGGWPGNSDDLESVCRREARAAKNPASLQRAYFKAYPPKTWADAVFKQLVDELRPIHPSNWWNAQQANMTPGMWREQCAEGMRAPRTWGMEGHGLRLRLGASAGYRQHDIQRKLAYLRAYLQAGGGEDARVLAFAQLDGRDNAEATAPKDWPEGVGQRAAKAWGWRVECTGAGVWVYSEEQAFQDSFMRALLDLWQDQYARALRVK